MLSPSTRVLIVGAGPVGLTAAIVLRQHGHEVSLVDAQNEGAKTSRAAVIHPRTLEVLQPYGVTAQLVERGVHTPTFAVRDRDTLLMRVSFADLATDYPYALMISQAETEDFLLSRLKELGGTVLRPLTLDRLDQDADGVTATFDDGQHIRAEYVLGADGVHSTVRDQAGLGFAGGTYAESFVLADVVLGGTIPPDEVTLYFSPAGLLVLAPLPDGRHRVVATLRDAPALPDASVVQDLLDHRGPGEAFTPVVHRVVWGSRFRVHHRVAESYRDGRLLLAGDSAHVHSPAGGQGMNLGFEDAVDLGERLASVLEGASPDALDAYSHDRRPIAQRVVRLAGRLTALATAPVALRPVRNAALIAAGRIPSVQRRLARQLAGLARRPEGISR
ncbi:FAD-dependent oxidoreductase [Citricoccus sp. GCM10030269]|uniref:FAD-dependent oxidoreductase n=1 Tax=Citricoccus sp. GCM10030269 TaxID=3273388 RepID=UPI003609CFD0